MTTTEVENTYKVVGEHGIEIGVIAISEDEYSDRSNSNWNKERVDETDHGDHRLVTIPPIDESTRIEERTSVVSNDDNNNKDEVEDTIQPPTDTSSCIDQIIQWCKQYGRKLTGVVGKQPPPMSTPLNIIAASVLGFIGILLVTVTDQWFLHKITVGDHGIRMLSGAYAATAGKNK